MIVSAEFELGDRLKTKFSRSYHPVLAPFLGSIVDDAE